MKIVVVGDVISGFRFYGPLTEGEYIDGELLCQNPESQWFVVNLEPLSVVPHEGKTSKGVHGTGQV